MTLLIHLDVLCLKIFCNFYYFAIVICIKRYIQFIGDTDLSVILALASCLESQKNSQDPSSEPEDPFIEGFSFYMVSEEARLASAFVAVWLTYRHSRNGNDELSTGRTWPLVMTVLSHEFGAVGMILQRGWKEGREEHWKRGGRKGKKEEEKRGEREEEEY